MTDLDPAAEFTVGAPAVVLFTGSRLWVDAWTIKNVLDDIVMRAWIAEVPELTFRHGACYPFPRWNPKLRRKVRPNRSADYFVHLWIRRFGTDRTGPTIVEQERPADWEAPCRPACRHERQERAGRLICISAGNYRNREMVLEIPAPLFVVAFHQDNSNGTRDCITTARELSVPVYPISPKVTL